MLAAAISSLVVLGFGFNEDALVNLFTASTLMPAILYLATVLLYVFTAQHSRVEPGYFSLGRWEWPVIAGALAWLVYELIVLLGPADFRTAQLYALGAIVVGVLVFGLMLVLEPATLRREEGAYGRAALDAGGAAADGGPAAPAS
jgi:uncharacterized integral membrane protein